MPREKRFIKHEDLEGALNDIERALQLMSTKLFKTTTVMIPPIPLSLAIKELPPDGEIFRGFFAVDGHISRVYAFCEFLKKDTQAFLELIVIASGMRTSTSMVLKQGLAEAELTFPVPAGARMLINVVIDDPTNIRGIWASALYEMDINPGAVQALSIDDLVATQEKLLKEIK